MHLLFQDLESGVDCFFKAKQNTELHLNNSGRSAATKRITEAYFLSSLILWFLYQSQTICSLAYSNSQDQILAT